MRCRGADLAEAQGRMRQVRQPPGASGWLGVQGQGSQGGRGRSMQGSREGGTALESGYALSR